jgi:hypothetical protein
MRKIKLKIFYINLFIVLSLYIISLFFKPNLNLQTIYKFENIPINTKINLLPLEKTVVYHETQYLFVLTNNLFREFIEHLTFQNIAKPLTGCPKEITTENFRTVHIYNVNESYFSVDINTQSSPKIVQKCFNKIFIIELNKFYKNKINNKINALEYNIIIQSKLYNTNIRVYDEALATENQVLDNKFSEGLMHSLLTWKMHLQTIDFLVSPNKEYKVIIKKNEVSYIIIYLSIILLFFFFQIFYYLIKKKKLFNKLLKFNF